MRQAEKRGYTFDYELSAMPKRITRGSVNRLAKIKPKQLYEKATYTTEEGQKVSGRKGLQIERKKRAEKAKATKIRNEFLKREYARAEFPEDFGTTPEPPVTITSGEIAVQRLEDMIEAAAAEGHFKSAGLLQKILDREIQTKMSILRQDGFVGDLEQEARNIIGFAMENVPEGWVDYANVVLYYKMYTSIWQNAYSRMIDIITGTVPTPEETAYYYSVMEGDAEWNDLE